MDNTTLLSLPLLANRQALQTTFPDVPPLPPEAFKESLE
jgi:hypothetical protein